MKHIRRVYSNIVFEHNILTQLILRGNSIGTFVKDGIIFHRCLITYVDLSSNQVSCRWMGMIPGDECMQGFKGDYSFKIPSMEWKEENTLFPFCLSRRYYIQLPSSIKAEDELIVGRSGNPYAPGLCPLR